MRRTLRYVSTICNIGWRTWMRGRRIGRWCAMPSRQPWRPCWRCRLSRDDLCIFVMWPLRTRCVRISILPIILNLMQILLIAKAKQAGLPVTCEVAPHHLFLTAEKCATAHSTGGWCDVRPRLAKQEDCDALWANMQHIDCFASDHGMWVLTRSF